MECKKMHGMNNIKFTDAQQAKAIYNFKNTKDKTLYNQSGCLLYKYLKCVLDLLLLINCLRMAPSYWKMYELAPNVKCVL